MSSLLGGVKNLLKLPLELRRNARAKVAIAPLLAHEAVQIRRLGEVFQALLAQQLPVQERALLAQIEQRRAELLRSDQEIAVIDYGAGQPDANRTQAEMQSGFQSTARVGQISTASKPRLWATFLFQLIRKFQPLSCLELGSCVGISAAYQAAALQLNQKGRLVTLEGAPEIAKLAAATLQQFKLDNATVVVGPFHQTLPEVLRAAQPIDLFFNDGHHDHDAVIRYFDQAFPFLADQALVVFDDISWSPGMRKAWHEIEADPRVAVSIELNTMGMVFLAKSGLAKARFKIPL